MPWFKSDLIKRHVLQKHPPNLQPQACNFIKKETLEEVFSCEFCEISKYTFSYRTPFLTEHFWETASSFKLKTSATLN